MAAVAKRRNLSISATILEAEQGSKRSKEEITAEVQEVTSGALASEASSD